MKTRNFSFDLPSELIAQRPTEERGLSRLLVLEKKTDTITHTAISDIDRYIDPGTVMVFNDSRVRKARLYASTEGGGRVELLLIRQSAPDIWTALTSKTRRQRVGRKLTLPGGVTAVVAGVNGQFRELLFSAAIDDSWLDQFGHVPLPPYIDRPDDIDDTERYQTVYSRDFGSVAAPTAGLHFTDSTLNKLKRNGVEVHFITLHVGAGTFFPIRAEHIEDHVMHEEEYEIPTRCASAINKAVEEGREILAVGTTSLRSLESASGKDGIRPGNGKTSLYIKPGYQFKTVTQLFTNFHTPESTLLVLVSAFAGKERIERAYTSAVEEKYRFFSYGDAMLIR